MKYLEYPELELLSRALTFESSECKVFSRIEAYSCKTVTKEKRLFKSLESSYLHSASTSPPDYLEEALASPFGRLDQPSARKTLFLLIATLNVAFPDHDFSEVNPADFRRENSPAMVLNSLSTTLLSLKTTSNAPRSYSSFSGSFEEPEIASSSASIGGFPLGSQNAKQPNSPPPMVTHPALSSILDDIMNISDCDVYTFHPDMDSDPHASAEPEEEGDFGDQDPYDDGSGYWDEGDADMRDREGTPRARDMDQDMVDTPMFDEDMYGGGFGDGRDANASLTSISSGPRIPANNLASLPARNYLNARTMNSIEDDHFATYSSSYEQDDNDDLDGTGAGLLWSTFAFFYNRKMKRILFVSVWSRKNSHLGFPTSSWLHPQPPPVLSASLSSPPLAARTAPTPATATRPRGSLAAQKKITNTSTSPAKRAIARTNSSTSINARAGRTRHARASSGSPAPSSLSPFPHASPRTTSRPDDVTKLGGSAQPRRPLGGGSRQTTSLEATLLSASAPAASTGGSVKASLASRSKRSGDNATGAIDQKRARKQVT